MEDLETVYALLTQRLPPLVKTTLNDRTVGTWRRHWIDKLTVREIARENGWSVPAVEWHLRRAFRALGE
jgi:DNA-directed RNA polymerase specialized sigma24 family protein